MKELIIVTLDSNKYAVWKKDIKEIQDLTNIHKLPLTEEFIAGVSIVNDQTILLGDLSASLGLNKIQQEKKTILLFQEQKKNIGGFIVSKEIKKISINPDKIYPIPEYLKTSEINSCIIDESHVVPIININNLKDRLQKKGQQGPSVKLSLPSVKELPIKSSQNLQLINCSNQPILINEKCTVKKSIKSLYITQLPFMPSYIKGLVYINQKIIPLMNIKELLNLPPSKTDKALFIIEYNNLEYGILADIKKDNIKKTPIEELPLIAQSHGIKNTSLIQKKIIPILNSKELINSHLKNIKEKPLHQRYKHGSSFTAVIGKKTIEVNEFSLLGMRYALPKSEIVECIPLKPFYKIPNVEPIIAGVAKHNDEILPVIDLAVYFGIQSPVNSSWKMLYIKNQDFSALILCKELLSEKMISTEKQRLLPINIPHRLIYECYPDEEEVILILNVKAMSLYYEPSIVEVFQRSYPEKIKQAETEIQKTEQIKTPSKMGNKTTSKSSSIKTEKEEKSFQDERIKEQKRPEEISKKEELKKPEFKEELKPKKKKTVPSHPSPLKEKESPLKKPVIRKQEKEKPSNIKWPLVAGLLGLLMIIIFFLQKEKILTFFQKNKGKTELHTQQKQEPVKQSTPLNKKKKPVLIRKSKIKKQGDYLIHKIRWGDTLIEISDKYTGDWRNYRKVAKKNKIKNPDLIISGERLKIEK